MKHTKKIKRKGQGKFSWVFDPPEDVKKAGIAERQTFRDGRTAVATIPKLLAKIDAYRKGELVAENLPMDCTLNQLSASYLASRHFDSLAINSREAYRGTIQNICSTPYKTKTFGYLKVQDISSMIAGEIYEKWGAKGAAWANKHKRMFGVLLSYAISLDIVQRNPMSKIKPLKHTPHSPVWSADQVEKFLDTAFTKFEYRNIGIIVLLCYEWGQRPIDIYHLKWDNIDFDKDTVSFKQRKRGATVELPLDPDLKKILLKQKEDYDFQELVVPRFRKNDSAYRPHTSASFTPLFKQVLSEAGLPDSLQVGRLRKTAIVEMVDSGVDAIQIMSVSGHMNLNSLNPYLKHTRKSAEMALSKRKQHR